MKFWAHPFAWASTALALAGAAFSPCTADASRVLARSAFAPLEGPTLVGAGVAFETSNQRSSRTLHLRTATGAVAKRTPAEAAPLDGQPFTARAASARLDGGDSFAVAAVETVFSVGNGRGGDPSRRVVRTWLLSASGLKSASPACPAPALGELRLGAHEDRFASIGPRCHQFTVFRRESPDGWHIPAEQVRSVQVAGDYTAWLEPSSGQPDVVVVVDSDGRQVLRQSVPGAALPAALALDVDGTVAVLGALDPAAIQRQLVAVASPRAPVWRFVRREPGARVRGIRLASGRMALLQEVSRGDAASTEVDVRELDGDSVGRLRGVKPGDNDSFDFDGQRIAARTARCREVRLVTSQADAFEAVPVARCALELSRGPRLTDAGLRVQISCRGFARDCVAARAMLKQGGVGGRVVSRSKPLARTFTLRLGRTARRQARLGRPMHLTATVADGDGVPVRRTMAVKLGT